MKSVFSLVVLVGLGFIAGLLFPFPDSGGRPLKDAAAALSEAKADETTQSDWVAYPNGQLVPLDQAAGAYVVFSTTGIDYQATFTAFSAALKKDGGVVKHVVCETYYDAPVFQGKTGDEEWLNGTDNLSRMTVYVSRCRFIVTSAQAAFHRLTGYATPAYAPFVKKEAPA